MSRYLFPQDYMADPSAHVFNDKIYVYPSHDWDSGEAFDDDGGHFQMKDYHVLRIDGNPMEADVTDCGKILDVEDVPWAEKQMWDNDVVEVNGKYHLIFAAKDYNGVFRLGVAIADRPEGPFIPQPDPIRKSYSIDPCVFKDDDGAIYVYFGGIWGGQLQWYRDNKALKDEYLPKGKEPAIPARVARMTPDGHWRQSPALLCCRRQSLRSVHLSRCDPQPRCRLDDTPQHPGVSRPLVSLPPRLCTQPRHYMAA